MRNAAEMFSFDPNPTRAKNAWSSSTCLLYDLASNTLSNSIGHWPTENENKLVFMALYFVFHFTS